jgi:sugar O-acyltransferase (sialic acid O-acetyltransferase NeuD family)
VKVIVVGAAGQGRQVVDAIVESGEHVVAGFVDDALPRGTTVVGCTVLGALDALGEIAAATSAEGFVVAIGDNARRAAVASRAAREWSSLCAATVRHPAALVARDATVGAGSILLARSVVSNACRVGEGVLMCTAASIDHDNTIEPYASLGPGATTGGDVQVGRQTAIGLNAAVIHGVTVGEHSVIGAGAVVLHDVPARVVAFGVPATVVRSREPGDRYL